MVKLGTGIYKVRGGLFKVRWSDFEVIFSEKGVYKINSVNVQRNKVQRENLAAPYNIPVTKAFEILVFMYFWF